MDDCSAEQVVGLVEDRGLHVMAAPFVLLSPTFQELWRLVDEEGIGAVHSAMGLYGNPGSTWARWYHESGLPAALTSDLAEAGWISAPDL